VSGTYWLNASVSTTRGGATGIGNYSGSLLPVGQLFQLENAVSNSSIRMQNRSVSVGGFFQADANLRPLVTTITGMGASNINLKMDLYPPNSIGCQPGASWSRNSSSLPLARWLALELWDPTGLNVGSMIGAATDGRVYHLGSTGSVLWSTKLSSQPRLLAVANVSGTQQDVYVATDGGTVYRLDALSGNIVWSASEPAPLGGATSVTSLTADAQRGLVVLNGASSFATILRASDGSLVARAPLQAEEEPVQVAVASDGSVLALSNQRLTRYDSSLAQQATLATMGSVFMAPGHGFVILANESSVSRLNGTTLAQTVTYPYSANAKLGAVGDVTGDGTPDIAVALRDSAGVTVIDGASGAYLWNRQPGLLPVSLESLKNGVWYSIFPKGQNRPPCVMEDRGDGTYQYPRDCKTLDEPVRDAQQNDPISLAMGEGKVVLVYEDTRKTLGMVAYTSDGGIAWSKTVPSDNPPTILQIGRWGALSVLADGLLQGQFEVRSLTDGNPILSSSPTQFTGQVSFLSRVPMGGLFGAHVLVATLSWQGADGSLHQARLSDWFHVVSPQGKARHQPMYTVTILVRQPDDRLGG
jgi:outer membrane protein assembly factor BamB